MFIFLLACILPYQVLSTINIIDNGLIPLEANSVGIQFFIDVENESRDTDCLVLSRAKRCCLKDSEKEDCSIMHVYGSGLSNINPRDRETLLFVYPTLFQHEQMGFCDFAVSWKCGRDTIQRRKISIPFDTRIPNGKVVPDLLRHYIGDKSREECTYIDEDPLNYCAPVDCDHKYSEYRPFYESRFPKCIEATKCPGTISKELPDIVYVPTANICRNLERPLTMEDVLEISKGLVVITESPVTQKNLKVEIKSNCSTVSQNMFLLKDLMLGKLCPILNIDATDYRFCMRMALIKIITSTAIACALMLSCLFCVSWVCWMKQCIKDGNCKHAWHWLKSKLKKKTSLDASVCQYNVSRIDDDVKNSLLRQVIVRDIPMELRDSMVDVCERMDKDIRWKKRYRHEDVVSLCPAEDDTSETSTMSDEEREKLIK
ncbi:hypothetical protein O0L34_g8440 [Tuta absoluta]|nr:hypothetical protein O0L34_g8440 [Tuta absoluta]